MFREKITRQYPTLSPSFKRIADFVLASHQKAAFMSASRLAKHVEVDVATVTRFAQQIGYDGYIELIREIQEAVLEEMRESREPVLERLQSADGVFVQTMWRDWAGLETTIQALSSEYGRRAVEALANARRIYLIGEGVGGALAAAVQYYLKMIRPDVILLDRGPFETALDLKDLSAEDVVLGIGFTSYAHLSTQAVQLGNNAGATTIGVIAQADCPIGTYAQLLFSCAPGENGYLPSMSGIAAILFALVYGLFMLDAEEYNRKLVEFQGAYTELTNGTQRGEEEVVQDLLKLF